MIKVDARKINMLRREIFMSKKYKVVTGKPLLEDAQQEQQLCRDSHTAVLLALALIDEYLLAFKVDVNSFEAASLAYS